MFVNLVASLISVAWAAVALSRPAALAGSVQITGGLKFYVRMYSARAIPFGLAVGILPYCVAGEVTALLLFTAGVIQFGDALIALNGKKRPMLAGASAATIIHILCGLAVR